MSLIEVKANVSFSGPMGIMRQSGFYLVDPSNVWIKSLIAGGYLTPTGIEEEGHGGVDSAGSGSVSGAGVGVGVARAEAAQEAEEVTDGTGGAEQR